ncbi:MAG TPA: protein phosphatase 2C domain-containing protein [Longimicrobiaceae bacterium]|nr:protein phosphatase 2C domain-containing protein [Longimicrobiaceae bacterium]
MSESAHEPLALHGLRFDVAAMSEQGPRSENQDAYAIDAFARTGVVALADGMGGERSGRVAADTALQAVLGAGEIRSLDDARRVARQADAAVRSVAESEPDRHGGMGCALGFLALTRGGDGPGWVGAHVGDVRILARAPDGTLRLETRDHTPAFGRWEAGEISLDEIPDTPGANRLQRAVGRGGEADAIWLPARPGWSWLLISDGVYKELRLEELARLMGAPTADAAVEAIRRKVEERGPEDNFTAVLVRALGDPEQTLVMDHPPTTPARRPSRSGAGVAALMLAILALVAAGTAFWFARQARDAAADHTEIRQLRTEVDSLRTQLQRLEEPFGPSAVVPPDSAARTTAPPPRTGARQ